jgi:hypothetical protein
MRKNNAASDSNLHRLLLNFRHIVVVNCTSTPVVPFYSDTAQSVTSDRAKIGLPRTKRVAYCFLPLLCSQNYFPKLMPLTISDFLDQAFHSAYPLPKLCKFLAISFEKRAEKRSILIGRCSPVQVLGERCYVDGCQMSLSEAGQAIGVVVAPKLSLTYPFSA